MATKQTRRSISVRGTTYDSLRRYSEIEQRSMSDIVEELLAGLLAEGRPQAPRRTRTVAPRVVRAPVARAALPPAAPALKPQRAPGRPAPTPARSVHGTQRVSAPKGDYRNISF
jgi:hypothetical protein